MGKTKKDYDKPFEKKRKVRYSEQDKEFNNNYFKNVRQVEDLYDEKFDEM